MENSFEKLNSINVNEHTEGKNGLTYLSWAWAWSEFKKIYPQATYDILRFDELPYVFDEKTGYMVYTTVTVDDLTHMMWLPVMDGSNKAMKSAPYEYTVKNPYFKYAKKGEDGKYYDKYGNEQKEFVTKKCEAATMFDVNKALMRCLTKNLAMFGLGLYIYAGEDLPEEAEQGNNKANNQGDYKIDESKKPLYIKTIKELMNETGTPPDDLLDYFQCESLEKMTVNQLLVASKILSRKKEKQNE